MPPSALTIVEEHQDLLTVTESLVREYHPATSAGQVITTVGRCRRQLMQAGVRAGLAIAVESMARAKLQGASGQGHAWGRVQSAGHPASLERADAGPARQAATSR